MFELIEQLKNEESFLHYTELLRKIAKEYVIMIVSCDTPWGPNLTKEMTGSLRKIGLTVDLFTKFRHAYGAVIDAGVLVFEKLSPSVEESVKRTILLEKDEIELLSVGYDAPEQTENYIKINGKNVATRERGLNIVVYNKKNKQVVDAVNFDVFSNAFSGKRFLDREKLVENYLKEHPGTALICFNTPGFPKENRTLNENFIYQNNLNLVKIIANLDKTLFAVNRYYDVKGVAEVLTLPDERAKTNGVRFMADKSGELVNIADGHRVTKLQPKHRKRTIFLLGEENVFGVGVGDKHTMASFLQALFDQNMPEEEVVVENYGHYYKEAMKPREWIEVLQTLPVCSSGGDVVLWNTDRILGVPFIDMEKASSEMRNTELFLDKEHYTPHGHKLIADKLYEGVLEQELLRIKYGNAEDDTEQSETQLIKKLQSEEDFFVYLGGLKKIVKHYSVIICSLWSCAGTHFTIAKSRALKELGLQTEIYEKNGLAYIAAIDEGNVIFEEMSSVPGEVLTKELKLAGNEVEVQSWSYGAPTHPCSYIKINEKKMMMEHIPGLLIVVFDKDNQTTLDEVFFATLWKNCACIRNSNKMERLIQYQKKHSDVVLIGYSAIHFPEKNWTRNEEWVREKKVHFSEVEKNLENPEYALYTYYTPEEIEEVSTILQSYQDYRGGRSFYDVQGKCVNVLGGHRVTRYQPEKPKRTLFLPGHCNIFGICNSDEHTLASNLQRILNQKYSEEAIIVQNYGYFLSRPEHDQEIEMLDVLETLPVKSGDIVCWEGFVPNCPYIDMSRASEEKRNYEIFVDERHYTPDGQRLRAEKLYEGLAKYNVLSEAKEAEKRAPQAMASAGYQLDENDTSELAEYKRMLIDFYNQLSASTEGASEQAVFGSIVMNCNPFTKGHRYLIDQALTKCDYLVVFVVEEDKSIFPFEDRFRLVVEGTEDLPNVIIIPSGRFIISSLTFSEYFNKSELQDRVVDTSMDVLMFVREIAPCLHITKRFAGEEPFDAVTRQYNESMKKILPEYGMEFVEIPRAGVGGEVISASRVRALLENKEFEAIEKLVPETTYRYLVEKFG